jgi:hypothetical protein
MYSHLVTLQAAGHDTTAYCACYTILLLAQNPEVRHDLIINRFDYMCNASAIQCLNQAVSLGPLDLLDSCRCR